MGNILDVIRLYTNYFTSDKRPDRKYLRATRSQNMRKALETWESQVNGGRKRKSHRRMKSSLALPLSSRQLKSKRPIKAKSYPDKFKLLKKHMREMTPKKPSEKNILLNDIKMRAQSINRAEKDNDDPLLQTFNIAARDSPSRRCNKWVRNMPHSSVWDKEHTLSGHNLTDLQTKPSTRAGSKKDRKRHRNKGHRVEKKSSQRSLLMKKIMQKKVDKMQTTKQDNSDQKPPKRKQSPEKLHPTASAGGLNLQRHGREVYVEDGSDSSCESDSSDGILRNPEIENSPYYAPELSMRNSDLTYGRRKRMEDYHYVEKPELASMISDDTATLKRKAKNVVRRIWSQGEHASSRRRKRQRDCEPLENFRAVSPKYKCKKKSSRPKKANKMFAIREAMKAHDKKITKLGHKSLSKLAKRLKKERGSPPRRKKIRLERGVTPSQLACMKTITEKKVRKKQERKQAKMKDWLREKTKIRPRCRYNKNIYARKHRPGLHMSQERGKASLGWAILQSIKRLEKKGTPYSVPILENLRKKWDYKELTLAQLKQALNWMVKKGILKSEMLREGKMRRYSCVERRNNKGKLPQRASFFHNQKEFAVDESDSSLEYGVEVGKRKKGPMRVRFRHGADDFTSVKCQKYGSHDIQSTDSSRH